MIQTNELQGVGRDEYDLNRLAFPYYDDFQQSISNSIAYGVGVRTLSPRILEIGVGTGDTAKAILNKLRRVTLTCLDYDPTMIEQARKNLTSLMGQNRNIVNLTCERAENYLPVLERGSLDVVVSVLALHNNPRKIRQRIYEEAARAMGSEGIFVLGDKFASENPEKHAKEMADMLTSYLILLERGRRDAFEYWVEHNLRDDQPDLQMTLRETMNELRNAGFSDLSHVPIEGMHSILLARK